MLSRAYCFNDGGLEILIRGYARVKKIGEPLSLRINIEVTTGEKTARLNR